MRQIKTLEHFPDSTEAGNALEHRTQKVETGFGENPMLKQKIEQRLDSI